MSQPGWFPDPSGQPGVFRWWDGQGWTQNVSPGQPLQPQIAPQPVAPQSAAQPPGYVPGYAPGYSTGFAPGPMQPPKSSNKLLVALVIVAGVVIVALVVWLVFLLPGKPSEPAASTPTASDTAGQTSQPSESATSQTMPPNCLPPTNSNSAPVTGSRAEISGISYPLLMSPWQCPTTSTSAGYSVLMQVYAMPVTGTTGWNADVLVGNLLNATDPQATAENMIPTAQQTMYGDFTVTVSDTTEQPMTIDGNAGWRVDAHMNYQVPGVDATYDAYTAIVVPNPAGNLMYFEAVMPNTAPQAVKDQVTAAIAGIQVT